MLQFLLTSLTNYLEALAEFGGMREAATVFQTAGGNHLMHAIRRNLDINIKFLINNLLKTRLISSFQ
mgnify:CR=1 FL=1